VLNLEKKVTVQTLTLVKPPAPGAAEKPPAKPPAKEVGPVLPEEVLTTPKKLGDSPNVLKRLADGKVPTEKEACSEAMTFKFKNAGGILAEETCKVAGLYVNKNGEPIWVVRFTSILNAFGKQDQPYEVRINAITGEAWRHMVSPALPGAGLP
jgi:hypothetical protein